MRRLLFSIAVNMILFSCQNDQNGYVVNGSIEGIANGKKVTLRTIKDNKPIIIDTTEIIDGKFSFKGTSDGPDIHMLMIQDVRGNLPFILGNDNLDMTVYKDSIALSLIKGSPENDLAQKYTKEVIQFRKMNDSLRKMYRTAQQEKDTVFLKEFGTKMQEIRKQNDEFNLKFIEENQNNLFTVLLLENLHSSRKVDAKKANEYLSGFPVELQQSLSGTRIKERIDATLATQIGSIAPDFTGKNPEGKDITLSEIRGKYTIIDFWAAWCGPCRRENPNIVKVYEKYKDKGLEIIEVSLDGTPKQNDPKQAWLDAIKKDSLTWHHVSNLNYFNDPIAKKYNIRSIPAMFVLDSEGKVVAKKLRGPALEQKISELLD